MNVAVDTNILAYAEGVNGLQNKQAAIALLQALPPESTLLPVQALGELFSVLVRKARRSRADASAAVLSWGDAFPLIETSNDVLLAATDLAQAHQLSLWDAVMLSAAADARCRLLLSEDLQDGFTWRGVTVTNPFASRRHPLLEALIST
ncbi:MAG: PIN domain-containing protein [Acidobacteria bacterium]|nr:PIN domain-containing protein [Acidobacteriota bacterium]MSO60834.1 PIN domain-containing protein [Acidobacteriota bacterium]